MLLRLRVVSPGKCIESDLSFFYISLQHVLNFSLFCIHIAGFLKFSAFSPSLKINKQTKKIRTRSQQTNKQKTTKQKKPHKTTKTLSKLLLSLNCNIASVLEREGARFTSTENVSLWKNQTEIITNLKSAPDPPPPNVYIPVICNESYLFLGCFCHLQLFCENQCFECCHSKILCIYNMHMVLFTFCSSSYIWSW